MYYLMNKDSIVAKIKEIGIYEENFVLIDSNKEKLPYGLKDINTWIEDRKASKHNASLRKLMEECGCSTKSGFIKITHAASLNDTFWIKYNTENISWKQISLYQNEFNEVISKLAFEGIGLYGFQFEDTSPELSTNGSFKKCWKREDDGIYLYKRGSEGARNAGFEPYCEVLASELSKHLCKSSIHYDLEKLHGKITSKCKLFTDENIGYVPISHINLENKSLDNLLSFYEKLNSEEEFRRMIILDSITFNVDRHQGNYGILIKNETLEPIKMAPVFDLNMSMLPYIEKEDIRNIGNKLLDYGPRIGDDFTRTAQMLITSEIRKDLINLKGFEFSFRGDERFPEERVKFLEALIQKQITAILSKDKLYTKEVFVPEKTKVITKKDQNDKNKEEYIKKLQKKIEDLFSKNYVVEDENQNLFLEIISNQNDSISFCIYANSSDIKIKENDEEISLEKFLLKHETLLSEYISISKIIDHNYELEDIESNIEK